MNAIQRQDNATLGITLVIAAMFSFATQDAFTKTLAADYAAPQIVWVRYLFYTVFALAFSMRKRPLRQLLKSNAPWLQVARSLLILAEIATFVVAVRYMSLAEVHAIIATFPLMVTAIAALFLGERVGIRRWMAVLAGFIGVLIIIRPGLIAIQPGVFVALATALMFAGYNVLTRLVARYDDGETSTVYMALIGTAVLCCIGPFYWVPLPAWDWFLLICLSLNAACGHFLLIKALEAAPAATLQPFNYTLLVFATVIGYFVFDNLPDLWTVTGAAVIVISGLYTIYRERERKPAG